MIEGLHLIPAHMHESVELWVERAEPHPQLLGSFLRAVLTNTFVEAACNADMANSVALHGWALFLYNYVPGPAWGTDAKLVEWYEAHHPKPSEVG